MGFVKNEVNLSVIAKKLGISVSTVSRALRKVSNIHPLTRERVIEEARALGYTWDETSRRAETGTRNVLMLSQVGNASLDGPYLSGLSHAAVELNLSLLAHHFKPEECEQIMDPALQPRALQSGAVDGVVLLHRWPAKVVSKLAHELPVVSIVHDYPGAPIDFVGIDEREGMIDLVRHLVAAGHRKIGFFGFCRTMSWARSRLGAYVEALSEMALEYDPVNLVEVSLEDALAETVVPAISAATRVRERVGQGVRAWIGASENLGYSLCRAILDQGLKIPDDVAITGFHASPRGSMYGLPTLTSTVSSSEELGAAALRRLVNHIQNPDESRRSILLPCTYFQGATTPTVKLPPLDVAD
jgi:DNA-binding LacI/PurR family transcriptional regulator